MQYIENTAKKSSLFNLNMLLVQGQILELGYRFVFYKSKLKKRLAIFWRMLSLFNI